MCPLFADWTDSELFRGVMFFGVITGVLVLLALVGMMCDYFNGDSAGCRRRRRRGGLWYTSRRPDE